MKTKRIDNDGFPKLMVSTVAEDAVFLITDIDDDGAYGTLIHGVSADGFTVGKTISKYTGESWDEDLLVDYNGKITLE